MTDAPLQFEGRRQQAAAESSVQLFRLHPLRGCFGWVLGMCPVGVYLGWRWCVIQLLWIFWRFKKLIWQVWIWSAPNRRHVGRVYVCTTDDLCQPALGPSMGNLVASASSLRLEWR